MAVIPTSLNNSLRHMDDAKLEFTRTMLHISHYSHVITMLVSDLEGSPDNDADGFIKENIKEMATKIHELTG